MHEFILESELDIELSSSDFDDTQMMIEASFNAVGMKNSLIEMKKNIIAYIQKMMSEFIEFVTKIGREIKNKLNDARIRIGVKEADENPNIYDNLGKYGDKKVNQNYTEELRRRYMDEYLQEIILLIREIDKLRIKDPIHSTFDSTMEGARLYDKLHHINEKYDKKITELDKKIVERAVRDGRRYSSKDLKNVQLDFEAVEKDYKHILKVIKESSNDTNSPEVIKLLKNVTESVSGRARRALFKIGDHMDVILTIFAIVGIVQTTIGSINAAVEFRNNMSAGE